MKTFRQFLSEEITMDIEDHMTALGYKFLGGGVDQYAYLEPSTGKVLKIFGSSDEVNSGGMSEGHRMFRTFYKFCQARPNNPFLPKFDGWTQFKYDGRHYLQIRMERLQHLPERANHMLDDFVQAASGYHDSFTRYLAAHDDDNGNDYNHESIDDSLSEMILLLGEDGCNLFFKTIRQLADIAQAKDYMLDLHPANFMNRNDGTPVIVDPWAI